MGYKWLIWVIFDDRLFTGTSDITMAFISANNSIICRNMNLRTFIENKSLRLKNDLFRLALMDKEMSGDESRLINSAMSNLHELTQYVRQVELDGLMDSIEQKNLVFFIEKIGQDCMVIAKEDKVVTGAEKVVLGHIRKTLIELHDFVMKFNEINFDD